MCQIIFVVTIYPMINYCKNMLHDGRKTFVSVNNNEERYQIHAEHPLYNTFLLGTSIWNAVYFYFILLLTCW